MPKGKQVSFGIISRISWWRINDFGDVSCAKNFGNSERTLPTFSHILKKAKNPCTKNNMKDKRKPPRKKTEALTNLIDCSTEQIPKKIRK
jgi:hypothetical protein